MAEAYPAFDLKNNRTPGSGSGPMGGPGPFAPSNTPIVYARGSDPVQAFMANLSAAGVAGINSEGIPVGSTGGTTFMWSDQVKAANEAAGGDVMGSMGRMNNQFLQPRQAQPQQPAPMAGNAFLNPTTDVRVNGLTPAAPGGTPLLGRDYGSVNAAGKAPNASFGLLAKEISLADGPVKRNGALFEYGGAGKGFSITQDPNTIPAAAAPRTATLNPDAAALAYRGLSAGMDRTAFQQLLAQQGAVPADVSLTPMEQAARARQQAEMSSAALSAFDRVASAGVAKTTGQSKEVQANRDQTFLKLLGLDKAPMADAAKAGEAKVEFSKNKDLFGMPKKDNPPTYIEYLDMRDQIEAKGDKATPQEKKRLEDLNKIITKMQTQSDITSLLAQAFAAPATTASGTDAW